jgi:hypothetical protein
VPVAATNWEREGRMNGKSLEAFQNKKMESLFLVCCQDVTVFLLSLRFTHL